ncbi:formylmethanofuran--tetrahydromethanopterin N-formyltransferase [Methanoplanus endosymbiosus]|uniref:Formylmethanofuran--tetrahydromethanopterin formyltransferase n=1 Tax=Methanoplanus endosymbiosus TaxID=33865 RepID=A0A9E7TGQ3_9EURY|nr:formylmethanofuran--tetrahydromethanopterin N-formyltransferase [Methanoplanus endosymbiosus]UUX91557.1 formylmethanofuran--tetrahydromethanopterin N-formyltransferase [Methanoplanus endosymbiosus]
MELNGVKIDDNYAEAFPNWACRVIITAINEQWAIQAATEATGFATSAIGCPCEAGIEGAVDASETPDGRPGIAVLFFAGGKKRIKEQVIERLAECVLTQPTTAVFDGMPDAEERIDVKLHFFGDGFEYKKEVGGRQCWAIPIMNGEYIGEENFGIVKGVAGGNFFIMGENIPAALMAAESAVDAIMGIPGCMCSFPVVASGSKVGSNKYKFMPATTNEKYCPSIRDKVEGSLVPEGVGAVYEIVIDGVDEDSISEATKAGIEAATKIPGIKFITAGNFGGSLGPFKFDLKEILGL